MKKDFAIFESVNYEKWGHSLKSLKNASSSLKDGLFVNIICNSYYTRRLTSLFNKIFFLTKKYCTSIFRALNVLNVRQSAAVKLLVIFVRKTSLFS